MFTDFEYLLGGKSFELEIWHKCYQHRGDLMTKISWQKKKKFSLREGVKFGNSEIFFTSTHVDRIQISSFV